MSARIAFYFKKWIYYQLITRDDLMTRFDDHQVVIEGYGKKGLITYWDEIDIVEEEIYEEGQLIFYLHYNMDHYHIAVDLFHQMIKRMVITERQEARRILLCCSGGMTSSYFKMKMNEYFILNHIPYICEASSFDEMMEVADEYDLILIAPQMRFALYDAATRLPHSHFATVPPSMFAHYDCTGLYNLIEENFKEKK
ncbi:MAG: PTS sugar transporter subunit IIB [bacterium]